MNTSITTLVSLVMALLAYAAPAATRSVDPSNPIPMVPYANWTPTATNIQNAVDPGNTALVTNGGHAGIEGIET